MQAVLDAGQDALEAPQGLRKYIARRHKQMHEAAANLEFEEAAQIRDEVKRLEQVDLGI